MFQSPPFSRIRLNPCQGSALLVLLLGTYVPRRAPRWHVGQKGLGITCIVPRSNPARLVRRGSVPTLFSAGAVCDLPSRFQFLPGNGNVPRLELWG